VGLEQPRPARAEHGSKGKGEAETEAVFVNGFANVPTLAGWLVDHLDGVELAELLRELLIADRG
jgi:hypothetical protein